MPDFVESFKEKLKNLENLNTKSLVLSKNYIKEPKGAPTLDFPIAKKMWAHIDPINEAFKTYFKDGLLVPEKKEEFMKVVLPELEYMIGKWAKWKNIEEYRGQIRDIYSKIKDLEL